MRRRDLLKAGLAGGASVFASSRVFAQHKAEYEAQQKEWLQYLCPPDDRARELDNQAPSPYARPFEAEIFAPALMKPSYLWDEEKGWQRFNEETQEYEPGEPDPLPDPKAHQRYEEFHPRKLYEIHEREFQWNFHPDPPYTLAGAGEKKGTWVWGFQGAAAEAADPTTDSCVLYTPGPGSVAPPSSPGPTYCARYGEPVLVRRHNSLPTTGYAKVHFALPSTTSHLHNGHTASESDGNPQDWIDSGEFWDHHYANFPLGFDPREKLTTLWYHDHRLDFTAANVYAGLFGFYLLFDEQDTGDENTGWRLPSGKYDVPLVLVDMKFQPDEDGVAQVVFDNWNTDGQIGDVFTVNRKITPHMKVARRKYRFRLLNGGPSRFYQVVLRATDRDGEEIGFPHFTCITGDGNFLPEPVETESIFFGVAQRVDFILDFSQFEPGTKITLHNILEQVNGAGPSGRYLEPTDPRTNVMQFQVTDEQPEDNSRIPEFFRPLPDVDLAEVRQHRKWVFDYDGGLWTINGRVMDPNRIDAGIEQGSAELWTLTNGGNDWSHPIHSHFTEFILLEVNGEKVGPRHVRTIVEKGSLQSDQVDWRVIFGEPKSKRRPVTVFMGGQRRDVANLLPGDEVKLFMRWKDFLGKHVMHCHNVVHEDHAMMIRWDIVEPGRGFVGPKTIEEVYGREEFDPPFPDDRPPSIPHLEERPRNPTIQDG